MGRSVDHLEVTHLLAGAAQMLLHAATNHVHPRQAERSLAGGLMIAEGLWAERRVYLAPTAPEGLKPRGKHSC